MYSIIRRMLLRCFGSSQLRWKYEKKVETFCFTVQYVRYVISFIKLGSMPSPKKFCYASSIKNPSLLAFFLKVFHSQLDMGYCNFCFHFRHGLYRSAEWSYWYKLSNTSRWLSFCTLIFWPMKFDHEHANDLFRLFRLMSFLSFRWYRKMIPAV